MIFDDYEEIAKRLKQIQEEEKRVIDKKLEDDAATTETEQIGNEEDGCVAFYFMCHGKVSGADDDDEDIFI